MGKTMRLSTKDRRTYQIAFFAFLLICALMGTACFRYYRQLQDTVKSESSGYMQEIAKQMGNNISKTIHDNFAVLNTVASVLQASEATTAVELQTVVQEQKNYWNYQKILLIDQRGVAYDVQGHRVALNGDAYLQEAVVRRQPSFSASEMIDGKDCIVFAIPMENLVIDGISMRALVASYELSTFDQILAMSAFDGQGYAHIVRRDGTVVVRSSSKNAVATGYNILNSVAEDQRMGSQAMATIRRNMAEGIGGQAELTLDGEHQYMTYTPLDTQEWVLLTFVPVSVVNGQSQLLLTTTLLVCGVLTLAFSLLLAFIIFSFYRNKRGLEQMAYVDPVTGGNTIQRFYELAQALLEDTNQPTYALIYTNVAKFKVLNEQFGRNTCDDTLRGIEAGFEAYLRPNECMGRVSADNFCLLVEYTDEETLAQRFDSWYKSVHDAVRGTNTLWLAPILEFGVYLVKDAAMPFPHMIDRAKLALSEGSRELRGKLRYAIYDERVRQRLFREKHLEDRMEAALAHGEFQVYLQPKYLATTERVGGAEALVRWMSADEGMIYPDSFIPVFERNGFIVQLDMWVFEEVCKALRRWLDGGLTPMKVSVNCSRVHLKNPNFLHQYCAIAEKYAVPPKYIEIELTETTVFEDVAQFTKIIDQIHAAGFGCSMDDFGSGYSSLNLIQDIPVDTLKLDKIFFRSSPANQQRTESVVGSIITMAKALSMVTVAEGVEERFQVEMLTRLGCEYIQGYYFSKPVPISDFEVLAFGCAKQDVEVCTL